MSDDLERFRAETRAWLEKNAPPGVCGPSTDESDIVWGGRNREFKNEDQRLWLERMAEKGWTVPEWPEEYGGAGLTKEEARILRLEMARIQARDPLSSLGIFMLGPALLEYGTEEQKREHLPKIARGEIRWAQGYSEPGAGSDLASIQTKAIDDGADFIVNGSKIWTSFGDKCDMIFALVRSEPDALKHLGITFLLVDMDDPGVTTRPITLISGEAHFTQTFFDDVRVPKANIVGERGHGWEVTKYLLQHERSMMGGRLDLAAGEETLARRALRVLGAEGLQREPTLRDQIIDVELDGWALKLTMERLRDQAKAKQAPAHSSSMLKLVGTELSRRQVELVMAIEAADGLVEGSDAAVAWLRGPIGTIAGGSNEIQLNILAKRALGLPGA